MIGLISNNNNNQINDDDDDDNYSNSKFIFTANSFTKQEIAIQILNILSKFDDSNNSQNKNDKNKKDIMGIKAKLSDALDSCQLLSSVLLRAKERQEHAKWLSRKKHKQKPTRNDITKAVKLLFSTEKLTYLEQILSVAYCKVVIYNIVIHWKKIKEEEKIIRELCKMFKVSDENNNIGGVGAYTTTFDQLINGLGFYFFSEIWRYQGCVISRSLSKLRAFQKTVLFKNIFENIDTSTAQQQTSIFQEQMAGATHKIFDDNIFNLLQDDGHSLRSLTASAFTLRKLQTKFESTFRRFRTQPTTDNIDETKVMEISIKKPKKPEKRQSQLNLDKNRFSIISNAIYECLHKKKKIPTDLSLDKHEFVHFIGGIFNFSFLYCGKAETRRLESWISTYGSSASGVFPVQHTTGRILLHQLLTNSSGDSQLKLKPNKSKSPPLEHVQRIRLSWHLFGVAFSIIKTNPFRKLIENPIYYDNGYLIGQPEPSDTQLLKASVGQYLFINKTTKTKYFVQSHQKTFEIMGGNECIGKINQNGNIIADTGESQSISISESEHNSLYGINGPNDTTPINNTSYQPVIPREYQSLGYILIDNKQTEDATRNLSEIGVYILRCFIECCLWLHQSQSHADSNVDLIRFIGYPKRILPTDISYKIHKKIAKYILKLQNCLGRSHEDVLYILHAVIHRLYLNYYSFGDKSRKDIESRREFESFFMAECVEPVIQNLDMSINSVRSVVSEDLFKKYWSKRIDMGFKKNNQDDEKEKNNFIRTYNAHLFLPFRHITISDFRAYVNCNADPTKYPITCGIIDAMDQIGLSIFATKFIPSIIIWMKLVHQRLSGRITKKEINELDSNNTNIYKYNADWLLKRCKEENLGDFKKYEKSLIGFVNGWNHIA
eukprot:394838_1